MVAKRERSDPSLVVSRWAVGVARVARLFATTTVLLAGSLALHGCPEVTPIVRPEPTCVVPKALELEIETSDRVNLDADGRPLPTILRLYQLTNISSLQSSAFDISSRNFCMSQAPVGQRSAHRPQCRQTSSSLAITRPVLRPPDT